MTMSQKKMKESGEKEAIRAYMQKVHVSKEMVCMIAMKATGTESKEAMLCVGLSSKYAQNWPAGQLLPPIVQNLSVS